MMLMSVGERMMMLRDWYHDTDTLTHEMIRIPRLTSWLKYTNEFCYALYSVSTVQSSHALKSNKPTDNRRCDDVNYNS